MCNHTPGKRKLNDEDEDEILRNSIEKSLPSLLWKITKKENLDISYLSHFLSPRESNHLFGRLEKEITYLSGDLAKVRVYGKWYDLPRQQAAFGDEGLQYKFSGCTVPAMPWTPALIEIKTRLEDILPYKYNFCLVNRYRDGKDSMGEHRDDEQELDCHTSIASVSLGQHRDFVFRHRDSRSKNTSRKIEPVKILLENGSLLLMNWPTNSYWYHSLPQRKKLHGIRINLTFRKIVNL